MKISVITVVLNAVNTIEQTIRSVIMQEYDNLEYIIIDGSSTDGTTDIIKKYENKISFWKSEPDKGIYDAMNKGIKYSTGDVIAFLNADDFYERNIITEISKVFSNIQTDVVYGNVKLLYENGYERIKKPISLDDLNVGMCMCHQAVFSKRELFYKYGFFNLNYKIAADYDAILKWYNNGVRFTYLDKNIANYGVSGLSSTEIEKCAEEVRAISLSYLKTDKKKQKYLKIIEGNYSRTVENVEQKKLFRDSSNKIKINLKKFLANGKRLYIFGSGYEAVDCYKLLAENDILFHGYIDNDIKKHGMKLREYYIYSPNVLKNGKEKVIVSSVKYGQEISEQLERMGYKRKEDFIFLEDLVEE